MRNVLFISLFLCVLGCVAPDGSKHPDGKTGDTSAGRTSGMDAGNQRDTASADSARIIADFGKQLKEDVREDTLASLSAAIFIGDKIVWSQGFGKADHQQAIDADTATVYRIGSISKTFTAYLMMLLVQDGTIQLDEPVAKYLPEIRQLKKQDLSDTIVITFRQLASHTSGLVREPGLKNAAAGPIGEWENKVLLSIPTTTIDAKIRGKFSYSNIGYGILGLALSRAAHKPFMEMVRDRIFRPLRMNSSFYIIPAGLEKHIAVGYSRQSGFFFSGTDVAMARKEHEGRGYKVPNGGIYSTPNDLARFGLVLAGNAGPLSPKYLKMMETLQTPESKPEGYGFGLNIYSLGGNSRLLGHNGAVAGYNAFMLFDPERRMGSVVMRNCDQGSEKPATQGQLTLMRLVKESQMR